jgi:hypothetical protein
VTSRAFTLNKGFLFVKPKPVAVTPLSTITAKDSSLAAVRKHESLTPPATNNKQTSVNKTTTVAKPMAGTSTKNNRQLSPNKNVINVSTIKASSVQKKTKTQSIQSVKLDVPKNN